MSNNSKLISERIHSLFRLAIFSIAFCWTSFSTNASALDESAGVEQFYAKLAKQFQRNYFALQGFGKCRAVVSFLLTKDNVASEIRVEKSPTLGRRHKNSKLADDAMIQAVQTLSPLKDVPENLNRPVRIFVIFDGRLKGPVKMSATSNARDALIEK